MFFTDLLLVLIISIILTGAFAVGFRKQGFGFGLISFFLLLFLATWAGGVWVTPVGPVIFGANFFSFFLVGLIIAMLLTALLPSGKNEKPVGEKTSQVRADSYKIVTVDLFFFMLVTILAVFIILAYL